MTQTAKTVFVVDDETLISQTLAMILNKAGFRAVSFDDAQLALEACIEHRPDLLITDVMMPNLTGIQLAIKVRQACPECRVLLFSGQSEVLDLLQEARENGHEFEVLAKPMHPRELLAKLKA